MPLCDEQTPPRRTRLESALLRLESRLRSSTRRGKAMESMYSQWQDRCAGRRDDIVRRLEAIDSQLDIWQPADQSTPRLALIGASEEAGISGLA
jgi:hypothetical protein